MDSGGFVMGLNAGELTREEEEVVVNSAGGALVATNVFSDSILGSMFDSIFCCFEGDRECRLLWRGELGFDIPDGSPWRNRHLVP